MKSFQTRKWRNIFGCAGSIIIFVATLVLSFMFGAYVGSEVTSAIGLNITSSVVNFIVGMISIGLISSVCIVVLAIIIIFMGFVVNVLIK